jgi:phosphate transport system protein
MDMEYEEQDAVDRQVIRLFALVAEAIARATSALLGDDVRLAGSVVAQDEEIDELVATTERLVWDRFADLPAAPADWRYLVMVLLVLPELERSADLAEHVAQRALNGLGGEMSPISRGVVQRMAESAIEMWRVVADAYADRRSVLDSVIEDDDELDVLHDRLTREVASEAMAVPVSAQVTLVARFYERLGDHAVNLARRVSLLPAASSLH